MYKEKLDFLFAKYGFLLSNDDKGIQYLNTFIRIALFEGNEEDAKELYIETINFIWSKMRII